ncbi:MAG: hypothetical protein DMF91_15785 [Acidobacteria bacterium]|nr:MAG: hypothetical protein DMF91_15785 [Acidobacteriota bacterium]
MVTKVVLNPMHGMLGHPRLSRNQPARSVTTLTPPTDTVAPGTGRRVQLSTTVPYRAMQPVR